MSLILASTSAVRAQMLSHAGVEFDSIAPNVDEADAKARIDEPGELARALAEAKAASVSRSRPDELVIGSDSVVAVGGRLFDKPQSREQAADHLRFFSGKPMTLTSAVALARAGESEWSFTDAARLTVRTLSEDFIRSYLDAEWPEVGYCVGVFRMEGRGVQLFEHVEGNHFTILGMPLIPLLGALRERGMLLT